MKIPFVDLKAQYLSIQNEIDTAIQGVLNETAFILGPRLEAFERDFAAFCRSSHCSAVGSGTDALYLGLKAMGVGPGDEVITVANTYIATVEAIAYTGARPVFVDVEPDTLLMDATRIREKITPRTKVLLPVHLYGQMCEMDAILKIASEKGLQVLEDCAQAHAAEYQGKRSPISSTAAYSFYPGKNLGAYGDAGGVVTRDEKIHVQVSQERDHGRVKGAKYEHAHLGFGFRMDTLQAAILSAKLPFLERWTEARRAHARHYLERLKGLVTLPVERPGRRHVYHVFAIQTEKPAALRQYLEDRGISTNAHYPIPVHLQGAFSHLGIKQGALPISEKSCEHLVSLPMFPELTSDQVDRICDAVAGYFQS